MKVGNSVKIGYLSQQGIEGDPKRRVIDVLRETVPINEAEARHVLAKFMFYGEQVFKRLEGLSGGERMRLRLAQLMHQDMNLLILDEPTNHLDIDARETLEEAIADYRGSLLIVPHDRYFLQKVVDGVFWFQDGGLTHYHGRYQEARAKHLQERKALQQTAHQQAADSFNRNARQQTVPSSENVLENPVSTQAEQQTVRTAQHQANHPVVEKKSPEPRRTNSFKLQQVEKQIAEWEARREQLQQLLGNGCNDYEQLHQWQLETEDCDRKIEELYEMWYAIQS